MNDPIAPEPGAPDTLVGPAADLWRLFAESWDHAMRTQPQVATVLGDHRFDDQLDDVSPEGFVQKVDATRGFLARLAAIDRGQLDETDHLNYDLFRHHLEDELAGARFDPWQMPLNQLFGSHLNLPQMTSFQPFETRDDVERWIARLERFPTQIDQVIASLDGGIASGRTQPGFTIEAMTDQCRAMAGDPAASPFLAPVAGRPEHGALVPAVAAAITDHVQPAYVRLTDVLSTRYLEAARQHDGIWAWDDGAERYAWAARHYTSTDMAPDAIHQLGLEEVARISAEMRALQTEIGFEGELPDLLRHVRDDASFHAESAEWLLTEYQQILDRMQAAVPRYFGKLPRAEYEIRPIETYREQAAPAAYYYPPPHDGSRPGIFYVNTSKPEERPVWGMEALAYHEAVPGHHFQISRALELDRMPRFRQYGSYTAYVEGWGLYSEWLAKEMGFYQDPYHDLGRLVFEIWRAVRLVVDTGVHHLRWTRAQALEYTTQHTAIAEMDVVAEIDRYIVWPGQALSYKVGERAIDGIRRHAQTELGDRFDWKSFHDRVLDDGALPLALFEARMRAWVAAQT